ncbi:hypothetical protein [Halostella litorea]|uniref:hypothetical protein n=1 Tax=Halostella litorea TaxID=2528831 RepID=UPI001092C5F6|nr:hypothetical protein [Halostella litorea]
MSGDDERDDPLADIVDDLTDAADEDGVGWAGPDEDLPDAAEATDDASHDDGGDAVDDFGGVDGPEADGLATDAPDADDAPLGDLAARVAERREERDAAAEADLFTEQSAADVDRDRLWEQITGDDAADAPPEDRVEERDERVVSKRSYCQGCEHFSEPPDVRCGHDGTEILEVVDLDHFRVVDCPVVREDELLGKVGDGRDG